ncbi:hypothetical protein PFICI_02660 [Pestalotiopsis fici W106-1]|uniref:Phosphoribulokinase/uridine kinase domain-containing protein n=1 Tax=Pestalotiopsis fici (strain W106-1 / CGMCC3.15140) TaxID=1229662 RepID=W3XF14_PESFW|nr:uncharacterized protein PFICI_02660 [Pestalotiopsis fici W106-1]ETS84635.1 hypothetical protein PFICI_02660 [Pestalotiopsis fici W106-1]
MESTYHALAQRIHGIWTEKRQQGQHRIIIALAGPPGSGKSTIAHQVVNQVAEMYPDLAISAISADGFHLSLAELHALPNAAEALARRGAPWTFNGNAVVDMVRRLRDSPEETSRVPTFDHAIKDPVQDGLTVTPATKVCLVEGNYLLSNEEPWNAIAALADAKWLVTVDAELATGRIAKRHLAAGIEKTMDAALARTLENDMVNGEYVLRSSQGRYDLLIKSIERVELNSSNGNANNA